MIQGPAFSTENMTIYTPAVYTGTHYKIPGSTMFLVSTALALAIASEGGTSWQGLSASALIMHHDRSFTVLHGSTLNIPRMDGTQHEKVGLCRTGILDNCALGLSKLQPTPRPGTEKCSILTGWYMCCY